MKQFILTILAAIVPLYSFAQFEEAGRKLEAEDLSGSATVYRTAGEWASVVFEAKDSYVLHFESNVDKNIIIQQNEVAEELIPRNQSAIMYNQTKGNGKVEYYIRFRTDKKYGSRVITVTSENNADFLYVDLSSIAKKRQYHYRVYDPYDADDGTYYQEHVVKGNQFFRQSKYNAAREEYNLAAQYSDITPDQQLDVMRFISNCDSMDYYINESNKLIREKKFKPAADLLLKAKSLNNLDYFVINRIDYCNRNLISICEVYYNEANKYYRENDYETAKGLFKVVIDNQCEDIMTQEAERLFARCELQIRKQTNFERYTGLEIGDTYGVTHGSYRDHTGAFFSLRTERNTFDLARMEYDIDKIAKVDFTVGATIPLLNKKLYNKLKSYVFKGVWLNVGVGVTATNKYVVDKELLDDSRWSKYFTTNDITPADPTSGEATRADANADASTNAGANVTITQQHVKNFLANYTKEKDDDKDYKEPCDVLNTDFGFTVNGEVGLTVRLWRFALRGTYFFRNSLSKTKNYIDDIGKKSWFVGVGWCW